MDYVAIVALGSGADTPLAVIAAGSFLGWLLS
jgi:hypothetical protein